MYLFIYLFIYLFLSHYDPWRQNDAAACKIFKILHSRFLIPISEEPPVVFLFPKVGSSNKHCK